MRNRVEHLKFRIYACPCPYMYYSRRHTCGTCIISLHTPFIFILLFSTVIYSVEIYGPETKAKNIVWVSIRITGEDGARTKKKNSWPKEKQKCEGMTCTYYTAFLVAWQNVRNQAFAVIGYRAGKMALSCLTRECLPVVSHTINSLLATRFRSRLLDIGRALFFAILRTSTPSRSINRQKRTKTISRHLDKNKPGQ